MNNIPDPTMKSPASEPKGSMTVLRVFRDGYAVAEEVHSAQELLDLLKRRYFEDAVILLRQGKSKSEMMDKLGIDSSRREEFLEDLDEFTKKYVM